MPAHEFQSKHDLKKNKTCLAACTPVLEPKIGQFMPLNSELCFVLARPGGEGACGPVCLGVGGWVKRKYTQQDFAGQNT